MSRLTALSLRQRSVVVLLTLLIALAGTFGITRLQSELIPNIEIPVLTVITTYPGAGPEAVDQQLSGPIAQSLTGATGLKSVQSTSSEGFSIVIAEFDYGEDMSARQDDVTQAVSSLQLPDGAQAPQVERINLQQFPVVQLAISSESGDLAATRRIAESQFVPALSSAEGVSRVEVIGGTQDMLQIALDAEALAENGITTDQVSGALQANNVSVPAGTVASGDTTLPVRVESEITSIEQLEALVVGASQGDDPQPITLGDIAEIEIVQTEASGVARTNGEPSIALDVYMAQGANTVDTAEAVREQLEDIEGQLAGTESDVDVTVLLDQSIYIEESIDALIREASFGAIFAVIAILVFLLSVRSTLVTAISIPLSMLVTFTLLWWQGISLNIMTLGGLAVAVGRVVDDSIVVLEAIYRHVQRGESTRKATLEGTKEVAMAITASTLTSVAVFLPLSVIGGLIGEIFRPFALTVTFALLASLLVSLTIVPVMASFFVRRDKIRPVSDSTVLTRIYEPMVRWALNRPVWTLVIAVAMLVASFGLVPFIGTSFLPASGDKGAMIEVAYPAGTSQEATLEGVAEVEQLIQETVEVETIQSQVGGEGLQAAFLGSSNSTANMTVVFDDSVDLNETLETVRATLAEADTGADITVTNLDAAGSGGNAVTIVVTGVDYEQVSATAQELTGQIAEVDNLTNVENDVVSAAPELVITVDSQAAAAAGTASAAVAGQVRQALTGIPAGTLTIDGQPMSVEMTITGATDAESLAALPVAAGGQVTLGDVATIEEGEGPVQVTRIDGDRAATVTGTITTEETGGVLTDVTQIINDYEVPEGVAVTMGGIGQDQADAFTSMGIAILVAIAAVYIVMVASFNSLTTPFVILFSLPLAIIGVLGALALTGKTLGLPALIGMLMLVGIVVTNAIVLLEYVIELRKRGLPLKEALIEGGKVRVRPILMTAFATMFALAPLALSGESSAIIASDLAVVVIGGLLTSTFLTLLVVPVIYELIGGWQERRAAKRAEREVRASGNSAAASPAD
jgi:hydrophobic/amphiphilic exporter-1 (mainly G- bacteria), HAE1 family